jgi:hypothetical protein
MKKGLGPWLDTDIIMIKPINQDDEYMSYARKLVTV